MIPTKESYKNLEIGQTVKMNGFSDWIIKEKTFYGIEGYVVARRSGRKAVAFNEIEEVLS